MDKKQSKIKGFLSTYKKSIITCVFSFIAMSLIFAVAISSNRTTSNIDNGGSNLEINKEEDIIKDPSVPTNNPTTISFILPLENYELTKDFSKTNLKYNATLKQWEAHKAVDLKASEGERVLAVLDRKPSANAQKTFRFKPVFCTSSASSSVKLAAKRMASPKS